MPTLQGLVMAVDTSVKLESYEDGDDDDEPIAYLRSKTASQRHDGSSKRNKALSPNGRNSSSHEGKVISSAKVPAAKSTIANTKALSSPTDNSKCSLGQNPGISNIDKKPIDNPLVESHTDSEDSDDEKPLCFVLSAASAPKSKSHRVAKECSTPVPMSVNIRASIKESPEDSEVKIQQNGSNEKDNKLVKPPKVSTERPLSDTNTSFQSSAKRPKLLDASASTTEGDDEPNTQDDDELDADSEDSDDEKPLNIMLSAASSAPKCNSIHVAKGRSSPAPSSTVSKKMRASIKKSSEGSKVEIQQNDLRKKDNKLVKSPKVLTKRPSSDINTSVQSSAKRSKQVDAYVSTSEDEEEESMTEDDDDEDEEDEPMTEDDDDDDDDDDDFIAQRQRRNKPAASDSKSQPTKKTASKIVSSSLSKATKKSKKHIKNSKYSMSSKVQPSTGEGQKWTTFVHNGVMFPPPYTPHGVKMFYNGEPIELTPEKEEVATMFAVMKDTEYATKSKFIENFMSDWRVILGKNHVIKKFELCDFTPIYEWHQNEKEKKKQMTKEEKKAMKEEKLKQEEKYMWAVIDGVKEKVGNFRVEPPGLFRGRGEHPKMGKLKKRILPSDITINIGKEAPIPECPTPGERWKEVKHDNTVTSIAYWNDPVNQKLFKYVSLHPSSSLKGQSDKEKYEKARLLKDYIDGIRANYTKDIVNKDITKRQIAVATYLIDKLALRAGNEKDDDEADTVGCCTLKVENVMLIPPNKLQFDFLGKDSIRYFNTVEVELPVYKAIGQFKSGKKEGEDIFDKLDTTKLNSHLKELMPGLTAKVFRTYNASITLDEMLNKDTKDGNVAEKIVVYQHANKEVAIICNHQRCVSKSHSAQMSRLSEKIDELKVVLDGLKTDLMRAKKGKPPVEDADGKPKKNLNPDSLERKVTQTNVKIEKMERDMRSKEDLKTVALGTSKINYLDPRISVAWCKRHEVPIEKIFNKSLLEKFSWAMNVNPSFRF